MPPGDGRQRQRVEVDQVGLMDKILARYATDFGALRELIQNADDARAAEVTIRYDASAAVLSVWNSGGVFSAADWERVRRIASGNPDAGSVGLFGVGFFTVFALTTAPQILSGGRRMSFALEGSEYVTYSEELPAHQSGALFVLPLLAGSAAAGWVSDEQLPRLHVMLASCLLFARSLGTIRLEVSGRPGLSFTRERCHGRVVPHEPAPREGMPPLFAVAGREPQLEISALTLRIAQDAPAADAPAADGPAAELKAELALVEVKCEAELRQ